MKILPALSLAILAATVADSSKAAGAYGDQQLMVNPFMEEDYAGWSPVSPWRNDGENHCQVFDFTTTGPLGFFVSTQDAVDLRTTGTHTEDAGFDPTTAELTGLQFNGVFLAKAAEANASGTLAAKFYVEFDIVTESGTYRAKSLPIENPWFQEEGVRLDSNTDYTWVADDGFLGYPFAEGGLPLAEIEKIDVKYLMEVIHGNEDSTDTVFSTIDNASIEYEVTVP